MFIITDETPKNCSHCDYHCGLPIGSRPGWDSRHPSCPIRELPPHGRLIDADALQEYYEALDADNGDYTESASETAETLANAPTIWEESE